MDNFADLSISSSQLGMAEQDHAFNSGMCSETCFYHRQSAWWFCKFFIGSFFIAENFANTDIFALLKKQMKDITVQFFSFSM